MVWRARGARLRYVGIGDCGRLRLHLLDHGRPQFVDIPLEIFSLALQLAVPLRNLPELLGMRLEHLRLCFLERQTDFPQSRRYSCIQGWVEVSSDLSLNDLAQFARVKGFQRVELSGTLSELLFEL